MQLLHENKTYLMTVRDHNMSDSINKNMKGTASSLDVKEKVSSNASLQIMNPVASGDNVANCLNSDSHRLKEELPPLVPCCEGKELQINEELVRSGLSAISVKHDSCLVQCLSMSQACEMVQLPQIQGLVKHRNSFRSLHRPDLKRVPYLRRMTPIELETLFRGYADFPRFDKKEHKHKSDAVTKQVMPSNDMQVMQLKETLNKNINSGNKEDMKAFQSILETRSGAEDVPAGMRLHGVRARLYTSVLAGANTGDQLEDTVNDEYDTRVPDVVLPEDEVQLHEELQIILPPRCEDITTDASVIAASSDTFS